MMTLINSTFALSGRARPKSDSKHFEELNALIRSMSRGKHRLPISLFRSPEPAFRARTATPDAVNEKVVSFSRYSSVHENSVVVLFWPESKALPGPGFDPVAFSQSAMAPLDGFFAIVGDHTQQAVKQLHRDYSRNAMWSSLTAEVLVCHRSAKNYGALKSWGILDNVKGEIRTNMSFLHMVLSLPAVTASSASGRTLSSRTSFR